MLIGIVGAPNKGKSTLFSALTMNKAEIADYPFTTIKPNLGIAYAARECAEVSLHTKCRARNSTCINGTRLVPVNLIDVAGLVPDAHLGRGMGNQFLNDLAAADALLLVVDASGSTDSSGNPCSGCDPVDDAKQIRNELVEWIAGIVARHMPAVSKRNDGVQALAEALTGLRVTERDVQAAISSGNLTHGSINWQAAEIRRFSEALLGANKPFIIAANKADLKGSEENISRLGQSFGAGGVVGCSAAIELALRKAAEQGIVDYAPGANSFKVLRQDVPDEQRKALEYMARYIASRGTNVQRLVDAAVFDLLDMIVVYPVEDEGKYADGAGNVLPDALLVRNGSTALDLANMIHTDIGKGMLYAVDARSKMRLSKDYVLKDNDVVRIVSSAKPR